MHRVPRAGRRAARAPSRTPRAGSSEPASPIPCLCVAGWWADRSRGTRSAGAGRSTGPSNRRSRSSPPAGPAPPRTTRARTRRGGHSACGCRSRVAARSGCRSPPPPVPPASRCRPRWRAPASRRAPNNPPPRGYATCAGSGGTGCRSGSRCGGTRAARAGRRAAASALPRRRSPRSLTRHLRSRTRSSACAPHRPAPPGCGRNAARPRATRGARAAR